MADARGTFSSWMGSFWQELSFQEEPPPFSFSLAGTFARVVVVVVCMQTRWFSFKLDTASKNSPASYIVAAPSKVPDRSVISN